MATAREIHRHMKGIKNIGQITKAMKMVAAARLRKAQEKAGSSRPYALKIKEVLANIVCDKGMVAGLDAKKHPLLQKREVKKIGYLVVCSDKGLAGAYSSNALKKAVAEISEIEGDVVIITSGRRARDFFTRRGYNVISSHLGFSDKPSYNDAVAIATDAAERFGDMQFDELHIVFTLFKNALLNLLLMVLRIVNLLILRCKLVSNVSMLSSLSDVVSANLLSVTVAQAKLLLLLILLLTKKASVLSAFM
jgi:F-type H+-transporting ATPase subunit gamma